MKRWIERQNAYSIIKLITIIMYLYEMVSSLIFSWGGYTTWGGFLSGTLIYYAGVYIISITPKGRLYYSSFFRYAVMQLFCIRLFHEVCKEFDLSISVQHQFAIAFTVMLTALAFLLIGIIMGKCTINGKKKITRKNRA